MAEYNHLDFPKQMRDLMLAGALPFKSGLIIVPVALLGAASAVGTLAIGRRAARARLLSKVTTSDKR